MEAVTPPAAVPGGERRRRRGRRVAAHEVMLPFVLGALIAYVLTPLVAMAERRKVPRPLAVLVVYAIVLGTIGRLRAGRRAAHRLRVPDPARRAAAARRGGQAAVGPGDHRTHARDRASRLLPPRPCRRPSRRDQRLRGPPAARRVARHRRGHRRTGDRDQARVAGRAGAREEERALRPRPDGRRGVGKTFAYAQQNSLEIARAVHGLVARSARSSSSFSSR